LILDGHNSLRFPAALRGIFVDAKGSGRRLPRLREKDHRQRRFSAATEKIESCQSVTSA
jgi:hypothetical protein